MRQGMKYSYLIDDFAQAELDAVGGTYISYFAKFGDSAKGRAWANRFYAEYHSCINDLKNNPYRYPICSEYPFSVCASPSHASCSLMDVTAMCLRFCPRQ